MRKTIAKIIHWLNPDYFNNKSYRVLNNWFIEDIVNGKLIFKK